ncbi:MAG: PSD1 and planctomycete cytochrome C domain-containing protein [Pirellulales bacterium]
MMGQELIIDESALHGDSLSVRYGTTLRSLRTLVCLVACASLHIGRATIAEEPAKTAKPVVPTREQLDFFESKIRPILVTHCYECHAAGAKIVQGGLRVDSRESLQRGGDSGPAVDPLHPNESRLLRAMKYDEWEMPPKGKLPDSVVQDFETWIRMGAPDPRSAETGDTPATRGKPRATVDEGREHWAFRPVSDPPTPTTQEKGWGNDQLDAFVLARLEAAKLRPLPDADRGVWLRRVSLDLTGLPPSVDEIESFLADDSPAARERVVDRLLASPTFGERWARHWLDLTGYADQVGTSNEVFAEHAWRYRDYLVRSFNEDKPFDRLLVEQIAGDLLPFEGPADRADNLVATGFLLVGDVEIVNPDKLRMETGHIDSQLAKIGTVFMGMTLGCARCHDHKFDPVDLDDYYAMAGTLRNTVSTRKIDHGIWSGLNVVELPETAEQQAGRMVRVAAHQQRIEQMADERRRLHDEQKSLAEDQAKRRGEIAERLRQLENEIRHAEFFAPGVPRAFAVQEAELITDMPIAIRGNPYAPGRTIPRGVMQVARWDGTPEMPRTTSGRLELARWLASERHPLTARVAVNRMWQKLFGEGLVRSVDYFGVRGETPTHPDLLDHLATRWVREGWSTKRLLRTLALSRTYGLSSGHDPMAAELDPDNLLIWRMNAQRLDAESIRDAMLRASGELLRSAGGPSLPLEYLENTGNLAPKSVNPPSFLLRRFRPEQEFVRTLYLPVVRSAQKGPSQLRDAFDFVQPAQIAGQRPQTVAATQALYLMNNPLPRSRAMALSQAIHAETTDRTERLKQLWLRTFGRPPTPVEYEEASQLLDSLAPPADGWVELSHALLSSNEFIHRQ